MRAGRQIIAWGRADGVNPTDNLSGQDLTLLVPDDVDRRLGTTAVRASYYLGDLSVAGVWLPEFRGHEFALPAPPPGVTFLREASRWPGNQWALRVEQTGRAVDWSVSYFRGRDTSPDLSAALGADGAPAIRLSHHRVRVLGGDMTANLGRFGLRAEGAYVKTEDADGTDPFTKNPFVFVVAGADRTFGGLLNVNVQYLFRYVMDDPDGGRLRLGRGQAAGDPQQPDAAGAARRVVPCGLQVAARDARSRTRGRGLRGPVRRRAAAEGGVRADRSLEGAARRRNPARRVGVAVWPDEAELDGDTRSCDGASDREWWRPCPWRHLLAAVCAASLGAALAAQPAGRRATLTGTVVAVNQQSDSVTLIDLQRMEAVPSREGGGRPARGRRVA